MRYRAVTLSILLVLGIAGSTRPAAAAASFRTTVFNLLEDGSGVVDEFVFDQPIATFSVDTGPGSQAQARVQSGVKAVRASASVSGASASFFQALSQVSSTYSDSFTMSAFAADGTPVLSGQFTATAVISGRLDVSGSGSFGASAISGASVTVNSISQSTLDNVAANVFVMQNSRTVALPVAITVSWFAGSPITLTMEADAFSSGNCGNDTVPTLGSFSSSADLSSTIEWTGIIDVLDDSGSPVASFTALNDSGIDYATGPTVPAAVPSASSPAVSVVILMFLRTG